MQSPYKDSPHGSKTEPHNLRESPVLFPYARPSSLSRTMSRRLIAGLVLLLVLAGGALLWWSLAGSQNAPPARQAIEGLSDSVQVQWTTQETAAVNASSASDALAAIGFVHGIQRPWIVTMWRRTALGLLSSQFGSGLVPLDRHTRRLGFARHAKQTYDQLSAETRQDLRAYTRGLNAALQSNSVRHRAPFVSLHLHPDRWAPWHPLAVERLLAWISTDPPTRTQEEPVPPDSFKTSDRLLRRWLHLHGRSHSVAWAAGGMSDTAQTVLFARHALGTTADAIIQEISIRRPEAPRTVVASIPGGPFFPTGTTEDRAWTYLLGSRAHFDQTPVDSAQLREWHERISPVGGSEQLVTVHRYDNALPLAPTPADSAWMLRWPGLRRGSDIQKWLTAANLGSEPSERPSAPFHLFQGEGLRLSPTGEWSVRGQPPIVDRSAQSVLIGRSPWARYQAQALQSRDAAPSPTPARWSESDSSAWAAQLLPRLLPALTPLTGTDPLLDDALIYLRNWDYAYESSSIGAVLFERWMRAYRAENGRLPSVSEPNYFLSVRARRAFHRAVNRLAAQYGTDVRRWRWERIAANQRHFLVWSADSLVSVNLSPLSATQFAPLNRPGRGHASALSGGPTLVDPPPLGPSFTHWEGWTRSGRADLSMRRLRFNPSAFFARSLLRDERPDPVSTRRIEITSTTVLVPSEP